MPQPYRKIQSSQFHQVCLGLYTLYSNSGLSKIGTETQCKIHSTLSSIFPHITTKILPTQGWAKEIEPTDIVHLVVSVCQFFEKSAYQTDLMKLAKEIVSDKREFPYPISELIFTYLPELEKKEYCVGLCIDHSNDVIDEISDEE